ncbi:hypothetical protein [Pseudomonas reactans]|uniref:hypothetical protein n=1 Tax=Pseudomonas reactans TaxID=117680 RepID=UPI0015A1672D|nr:hypothetical protein [Pseudomonas reactans]NWC90310.1 hypothetical protein [Pseudomonas reactans]
MPEEFIEDEFDIDESMRELDALEAEIQELLRFEEIQSAAYDKAFAWWDVVDGSPSILKRYKSSIVSLEKMFPTLSDSPEDRFSRGTLLVGLVSAYEGLVHDFFLLCCQSYALATKAASNLKNLLPEDKSYLGLKVDCPRDELILKLKKKTFHDPTQVARLCNVLFELPLPKAHEKEVLYYNALLKARNSYTHNGGYEDGKEYKVSMKTLRFSFKYFHMLADSYERHIGERAVTAADEADKT